MGRLVRRYIRVYDEMVRNNLKVGISTDNIVISSSNSPIVQINTDVIASAASGNLCNVQNILTISGNSDISGSLSIWALLSQIIIEGHTSVTTLSTSGFVSPLIGFYYTDDVASIAVTNGIHCGVAGIMMAGQNFTRSSVGTTCCIAAVAASHAGAVFGGDFYGIWIGKTSGQDMDYAFFIRDCKRMMQIESDGVIASFDGNTALGTRDPDGWIAFDFGGEICYLWTYGAKS